MKQMVWYLKQFEYHNLNMLVILQNFNICASYSQFYWLFIEPVGYG